MSCISRSEVSETAKYDRKATDRVVCNLYKEKGRWSTYAVEHNAASQRKRGYTQISKHVEYAQHCATNVVRQASQEEGVENNERHGWRQHNAEAENCEPSIFGVVNQVVLAN